MKVGHMQATIEELIARTADGDIGGRNALMEALFSHVSAAVKNLGAGYNEEEREAYCSQITLWMLKDLPKLCRGFDPEKGKGISYFRGIIHNNFKRFQKRSYALKRSSLVLDTDIEDRGGRATHAPEDALDDKALVSMCMAFIATLSGDNQVIFTQRVLEGQSSKSVASLLGIQPGTVDQRVRRLRKSLKVYIEEELGFITVALVVILMVLALSLFPIF